MGQAATIIDLDTFRRRREEGRRERTRSSFPMPRRPSQVAIPVWIAWVPVWPVV